MLTHELNYLLLLDHARKFPLPKWKVHNIKFMELEDQDI